MLSQRNLPKVDWSEIEASAPAKFIISGEYGVVYDKQAIAATIDLRTKVKITPFKENKVRLILKDLDDIREWPITSLINYKLVTKYLDYLDYKPDVASRLNSLIDKKYIVVNNTNDNDGADGGADGDNTNTQATQTDTCNNDDKLKQANAAAMAFLLLYISIGDSYYKSARIPLQVEIESNIPIGSGLGSSSALGVALTGALLRVFRVSAEKWVISKWAFNIDKFFHGQPSGVDNNIISSGGFILFQTGKIKENRVKHNTLLKVLLIDTKVSRSTKDLLGKVIELNKRDPTGTEQLFTDMNAITSRIWVEINKAGFRPSSISQELKANQRLLDKLGVGHERIKTICAAAERFNLRAKQTGAGGGGTAFVLYNDDDANAINRLKEILLNDNYNIHEHLVGCEGLIVKKNLLQL